MKKTKTAVILSDSEESHRFAQINTELSLEIEIEKKLCLKSLSLSIQ